MTKLLENLGFRQFLIFSVRPIWQIHVVHSLSDNPLSHSRYGHFQSDSTVEVSTVVSHCKIVSHYILTEILNILNDSEKSHCTWSCIICMLKPYLLLSEWKVKEPVLVNWGENSIHLHLSTAKEKFDLMSRYELGEERPVDLLTSHQWGPELFMRSTHRGSDFEKASMSSRFSQEMLTATLVTMSVALGPWVPNDAITAWRTHTDRHGLTNMNTVKQP